MGTGAGAQDPAAPRGWARRAGGAPTLERGGDRTHVCTHSAGWGVFPERRSVTPRAKTAPCQRGEEEGQALRLHRWPRTRVRTCVPEGHSRSPWDGPRAALPAPRPAHKCPLHSVCPGGGNTCSVTVTCQGTKNNPPGERGRWQASWLALEPRRPGGGGHRSRLPLGLKGQGWRRVGVRHATLLRASCCPCLISAVTAGTPRGGGCPVGRVPPVRMRSRAPRRSHVLTVSAPARHPRRPPSPPCLAAWHRLGKSRGWLPCQARGARGVRPGAREREERREGGPALPPRPCEGGQRSDY